MVSTVAMALREYSVCAKLGMLALGGSQPGIARSKGVVSHCHEVSDASPPAQLSVIYGRLPSSVATTNSFSTRHKREALYPMCSEMDSHWPSKMTLRDVRRREGGRTGPVKREVVAD